MPRRPSRLTPTDWRLICSAVKEAGISVAVLPDETIIVRPGPVDLPGTARNADNVIEFRLANAPWKKK